MTRRPRARFLFLQGPPGPFFARLAAGLRAEGHHCCRINLNGGDWLDWRGAAHRFTGTIEQWPAFLDGILDREQVSDIILFGDCRPPHARAIAIAKTRHIPVHVFEEGYIRPDWVTLERDGVNGHSRLPRSPGDYLRIASDLPAVPAHPPIPASFRQRASEALRYFLATYLLTPWYPGYRSHRPYASSAELAGWIGRFATRPLARLRAARSHRRIGARRYFVVPLQLDSDHQIRTHSHFVGMDEAITYILASFARHAPPDTLLVVKEHPLDNGLRNWRRLTHDLARGHGIDARVLFLDHGDIDALVSNAAGVVTVNSTTGTLALAAGTPVAVLGVAVYDLPGITHAGDLDGFWRSPEAPQPALYDAFRRVLVARCLLRGGFGNVRARAHLIPAAVARLCEAIETSPAAAHAEPCA